MSSSSDTNHGLTGGLQTNLATAMTIAAFTGIAWTNSVELNVRIWTTFKRRTGLYFWSLVISSWGVILYSFAFLVKFFQVVTNNYVSVTLITIGWWAMVTGQSLVLYSRLHLIVRDERRIRWVLIMILADALLFHTPTTIATYGANSGDPKKFEKYYQIMEKIQVTAFCIQEFVISGIYLWETRKILKPGEHFQKKRVRKVMRHLYWINILIILMDVTLLATEYANLYEIQITFKGAVYAIKLRLEFAVLNQLLDIVRGNGSSGGENPYSNSATNDIRLEILTSQHHANTNLGSQHGKAYSVFVGKNKQAKNNLTVDDGVVLKTTEVTIHGSDKLPPEDKDGHGSRGSSMSGESPKRPTRSPASSEIEFAAAGA